MLAHNYSLLPQQRTPLHELAYISTYITEVAIIVEAHCFTFASRRMFVSGKHFT